jgi:hypothetical protein
LFLSVLLSNCVIDESWNDDYFILQMDCHKYVKVAYHGFKEMLREDRFATYGNTLLQESFDEPDYALIDTLFSLAEAYLFAQLVELKDAHPEKLPAGTEYEL